MFDIYICCCQQVSKDTTDILVEVTSSNNLDTCKKVLDELLKEMLEMDISNKSQGKLIFYADTINF